MEAMYEEIRMLEANANDPIGFKDARGWSIYSGDTIYVVDRYMSFKPFTGVVFEHKKEEYTDDFYKMGEDADPQDFLADNTCYYSVYSIDILKALGVGFYSDKKVKRFFYKSKDTRGLFYDSFDLELKLKNQKDIFFKIEDRGLQWNYLYS